MSKEMTPIMQAVVKVLQRNPAADFRTVEARVAGVGKLFPIVYGRAKALLGLVKSKPRKDRVATATTAAPARRRKLSDAVAAAHERRERAANNGSLAKTFTGVDPAQGLTHCMEQVIKQRNELQAGLESVRKTVDELLQAQADSL